MKEIKMKRANTPILVPNWFHHYIFSQNVSSFVFSYNMHYIAILLQFRCRRCCINNTSMSYLRVKVHLYNNRLEELYSYSSIPPTRSIGFWAFSKVVVVCVPVSGWPRLLIYRSFQNVSVSVSLFSFDQLPLTVICLSMWIG